MRLFFLIGILLSVMVLGIVRHAESIRYLLAMQLPQAHHCNDAVSPEIQNLLQQFHQMGFPGGQVSFLPANAPELHCSFGWHSQGLLPRKVQTGDSFRYASLSKVLTALTAFTLIEQERITLSTPLLELVALPGYFSDDQIPLITIKHLLSHQAGFDRAIAGDPMLDIEPWCPAEISTLQSIALNFPPGDKMVYSNLGYCLLGLGMANLSQQPLEHLIRETLLLADSPSIQPILSGQSHDNEVGYFFDSPDSKAALLQLNYNAKLASGGWMGTATELSLLIQQHLPLLYKYEHIASSDDYMKGCDAKIWRNCHGLVFYKYDTTDDNIIHFWRDGSLPGVTAFTIVTTQGDVLVMLGNYRPYHWLPHNDRLGLLLSQILSHAATKQADTSRNQ